jgi:hypothetical protein
MDTETNEIRPSAPEKRPLRTESVGLPRPHEARVIPRHELGPAVEAAMRWRTEHQKTEYARSELKTLAMSGEIQEQPAPKTINQDPLAHELLAMDFIDQRNARAKNPEMNRKLAEESLEKVKVSERLGEYVDRASDKLEELTAKLWNYMLQKLGRMTKEEAQAEIAALKERAEKGIATRDMGRRIEQGTMDPPKVRKA